MTEREHGHGEGREPLDEEAAWAQIVAGYGKEPADPPGWEKPGGLTELSKPEEPGGPSEDEKPVDSVDPTEAQDGPADRCDPQDEDEPRGGVAVAEPPAGHFEDGERTSGGQGERAEGEGSPAEDSDRGDGPVNDADQPVRTFTVYAAGTGPRDFMLAEPDEEDDHFVPPEPPPLPKLDTTAKFAWLAVLGGPAILFSAVLLQIPINWWMITLGVGGFLGGFGTLVSRLGDDRDDDFEDPGRGAVV